VCIRTFVRHKSVRASSLSSSVVSSYTPSGPFPSLSLNHHPPFVDPQPFRDLTTTRAYTVLLLVNNPACRAREEREINSKAKRQKPKGENKKGKRPKSHPSSSSPPLLSHPFPASIAVWETSTFLNSASPLAAICLPHSPPYLDFWIHQQVLALTQSVLTQPGSAYR
jgi:hypothetical protein